MAVSKKIEEASFGSKCLPVIVHLWSMSDRSVRTNLLKSLKNLVELIPEGTVNKNIIDPMLAGFGDSNSKMREETLKSLVHIVDKLDERNLQDKLVRCITTLQGDAEASIRTNATIFLGRIATKLKESVRVRVLCNSFAKAMKDNFVHCRIAGLKATQCSLGILDLPQLTGKILPQACLMTCDKSGEVRELSLALLQQSLAILNENHNKMSKMEKVPRDATDTSTVVSTSTNTQNAALFLGNTSAGWTSWAVDGLSKTLEKATIVGEEPANFATSHDSGSCQRQNITTDVKDNVEISQMVVADQGWGDVDDGLDSDDGEGHKFSAAGQIASKFELGMSGWGDDEIDFNDVDVNTVTQTKMNPQVNISSVKSLSINSFDDFDDDSDAFSSIPIRAIVCTEKKDTKSEQIISSAPVDVKSRPILGMGKNDKSKRIGVSKLKVESDENWEDF